MNYGVNLKTNRAVQEAPFGLACYEWTVQGDRFVGAHCGVVGTTEDAEKWLRGEHVQSLIRVYPLKDRA